MKNLTTDESAVLPLIVLVGLLIFGGIALLILAWIVVALTTKTLITVALVGVGLLLLVKPKLGGALGPRMKLIVPLGLIAVGIMVYLGAFNAFM